MIGVPIVVWVIAVAVYDWRQRRLPNWLTLGGVTLAVVHLLLNGHSVLGASATSAGLAGVGVLVVLLPCYGLGLLAAGDIKLMSAIGFLGGLDVLVTAFIIIISSSVLALPCALWLESLHRRGPGVAARPRLPQGVFLGLGLLVVLLS